MKLEIYFLTHIMYAITQAHIISHLLKLCVNAHFKSAHISAYTHTTNIGIFVVVVIVVVVVSHLEIELKFKKNCTENDLVETCLLPSLC